MILSIDASTKSTGWALFDNKELIDYGVITASGRDMIKRVQKITIELNKILNDRDIKTIIMEEVRQGDNKQIKTFKALMYLQAAFAFCAHEHNIEITFLYPSEWRKTCGIRQGRGEKRDALKIRDIEFVNKKYNLNLTNDDIADAIGIGYSFIHKKEENNDAIIWA